MEPSAKKSRGLWTLQQLEAAMAAVNGKVMSQRAAAEYYSIPRRTLVNHLKSGKIEKQIGRRTILTKEQENDLASRIKRLAMVGFPLTPKVIRHQAYVFCENNNISNSFNKSTRRAGKDWLKLFLKRHPDISKRKVQILNPGRAQKLNRNIVTQHFLEYKKIYEELDITNNPERLFNMDEKGCRLTLHNQPIILASKGTKRVHMVAPEHAENVTVAACVNALGVPIPPMIIFKGKRLKPELCDNLPAGSIVRMAPKGSMTSSLFVDFIHHLGKHKTRGKCLLVFDGASCHLDYSIVDAADEEDIVLYCLPSNTTHELQPLDKSVNKSFEHHWDEQTLSFLYQFPDKKLTKARFNTIFTKVWSKCMSHENIVNGFRATGLYPYNPDAIPAEAYAPSVLTERPQDNVSIGYKSPTPGPSGINIRSTSPICGANNSDSDITFIDEHDASSPSLLDRNIISPRPTRNSELKSNCKPQLVNYSSTDSDSENEKVWAEPSTLNVPIRRPIIYSSESDVSFTDEAFIMNERARFQVHSNLYSSSEDENRDPLTYLQQEQCTPTKKVETVHTLRQVQLSETSDYDSEDEIPLIRLKRKEDFRSPFQKLIPTPNFAVIKQKPRRKAINYKGRIITKNIFADREKKKEAQKKSIYKESIKVIKGKNLSKSRQRKQSQSTSGTKKKQETKKLSESSDNKKELGLNADDKWFCHACNEERFEDMRMCSMCKRWFHEDCLGLTENDINFACPFCE